MIVFWEEADCIANNESVEHKPVLLSASHFVLSWHLLDALWPVESVTPTPTMH